MWSAFPFVVMMPYHEHVIGFLKKMKFNCTPTLASVKFLAICLCLTLCACGKKGKPEPAPCTLEDPCDSAPYPAAYPPLKD